MHADPIVEEFQYAIQEDFLRLQAAGKCGEIQGDGKRCKSPAVEWFDLDPDRPFPHGPRVGACGTHIKMVAPKVKNLQTRVYDRRVEQYLRSESHRIVRALKLAGFKLNYRNFSRSGSFQILVENPAEFLYTLGEVGVLEKLGIDVEQIEQCDSVHDHWGSKYFCQEAKGHYPKTKHSDWADKTWDDPKPVEPEPIKELEPAVDTAGTGGQFS